MTLLERKQAELEKYEHELQVIMRTKNHFSEYFQDQISEVETKIKECKRGIDELRKENVS